MARPRRSTIDEFIDQFADWDVETQERVMDQLVLVQRLAKRRNGRLAPAEPEISITLPQQITLREAQSFITKEVPVTTGAGQTQKVQP